MRSEQFFLWSTYCEGMSWDTLKCLFRITEIALIALQMFCAFSNLYCVPGARLTYSLLLSGTGQPQEKKKWTFKRGTFFFFLHCSCWCMWFCKKNCMTFVFNIPTLHILFVWIPNLSVCTAILNWITNSFYILTVLPGNWNVI